MAQLFYVMDERIRAPRANKYGLTAKKIENGLWAVETKGVFNTLKEVESAIGELWYADPVDPMDEKDKRSRTWYTFYNSGGSSPTSTHLTWNDTSKVWNDRNMRAYGTLEAAVACRTSKSDDYTNKMAFTYPNLSKEFVC